MPSRILLAGFALLLLSSGCSQRVSPPATVPVTGSVTFKGKPIAGIRVTMHPQFKMGRTQWGVMAESGPKGEFAIGTGGQGNGAPPGEYIVTFTKPRIDDDPRQKGVEVEIDDFKGKYSDPAESPWIVSIKKGENRLEPFELD